jgi:membrane-bound acyltransferase YfiQ involved in biofilm formation
MKNTTLAILASLFTVLAPVQPLVLVAILAIFIDTIFGVWRSVKKNGWSSFKSRRLSDTLGKAALYSGGIVFTFLIERFIAGDIIAHFIAVELIMTKFVAFFCVVVEVKSINESYESVTGKNILAAMRRFVTRSKSELDNWK